MRYMEGPRESDMFDRMYDLESKENRTDEENGELERIRKIAEEIEEEEGNRK